METFVDFLNSVLGEYVPQVVVVGGETIALSGMAGVDFTYIFRALFLILVIYCLFKLLGGIVWKT